MSDPTKQHTDALLAHLKDQHRPWREVVIQRLALLGLNPDDRLEMRFTAKKEHIVSLAQRACDAFFTAFSLYPTAIAMHSANAAIIEASEAVMKAKHCYGEKYLFTLGEGFETHPIHVEIDDSIDISCVAVRFSIDFEEYREAALQFIIGSFSQGGSQ